MIGTGNAKKKKRERERHREREAWRDVPYTHHTHHIHKIIRAYPHVNTCLTTARTECIHVNIINKKRKELFGEESGGKGNREDSV
jgi:hypothetical protein